MRLISLYDFCLLCKFYSATHLHFLKTIFTRVGSFCFFGFLVCTIGESDMITAPERASMRSSCFPFGKDCSSSSSSSIFRLINTDHRANRAWRADMIRACFSPIGWTSRSSKNFFLRFISFTIVLAYIFWKATVSIPYSIGCQSSTTSKVSSGSGSP